MKLKNTFFLSLFLIGFYVAQAQSNYMGLSIIAQSGNIEFSSTESDKEVLYSPRMTSGWGFSYAYNKNSILIETGLSYSRIQTSITTDPELSDLSLEYLTPKATFSYLFMDGSVGFKIGAGLGAGILMSGEQRSLKSVVNVIESDVYKRLNLGIIGQAGLVVKSSKNLLFQCTYQYQKGLSNIEQDPNQTTKTISHGIQASILFSI